MSLIDIGFTKQFFIDDYLIESLINARQALNPAQKSIHNPIIQSDRPWEGNCNVAKYVYFDEDEDIFKMWYTTEGWFSQHDTQPSSRMYGQINMLRVEDSAYTCFATSTDGIHWEKPALGLVEFEGSKDSNIFPKEAIVSSLYHLFYDAHETNPEKRFKGMRRYADHHPDRVKASIDAAEVYYTVGDKWMQKGNRGLVLWDLYYSPDGFDWTPYPNNPVMEDPPYAPMMAGPTRFMWDPLRQTYASHTELSQHSRSTDFERHGRLVGLSESPDMTHWSFPETIIVPDEKDRPSTQFYCTAIGVHEGVYIGLVDNYILNTGEIFPELVFSRDGIHYHRGYREPFISLGSHGAFDGKEIYPEAPIFHEDQVLIYYTGRNSGHDLGPFYEQEMGEENLFGAIGVATVPLDQFVSIDSGKYVGEVTTRAFTFSGRQLYLNVAGREDEIDVRVEILGPASHLIPGFTVEDADPINTRGLAHMVSWNGVSDLSHLQGKAVKLRIYLKHAKLYSFEFG